MNIYVSYYYVLHYDSLFDSKNNSTKNSRLHDNNYNFGILLIAYSKEAERFEKYLNETNNLCKNILNQHENNINVSLFTERDLFKNYSKMYIKTQKIEICKFDKILFIDKYILNDIQKMSKSYKNSKYFIAKRILLLKYTPYFITMTMDSDIHICNKLNINRICKQFINKNIDFAFTSFRKGNYPQGGLFLYKLSNNTKYLFNQWFKYHINNNLNSDQYSLNHTINKIIKNNKSTNLYLLNNRYNFRFLPFNKPNVGIKHPNNNILAYHARQISSNKDKNQTQVCQKLNNNNNKREMVYILNDVNISKCYNNMNNTPCTDKKNYNFIWSKDYKCQWNNNVDFVPLQNDTCFSIN